MKLIISKDGPRCGRISLQKFFQFSVIGNKKTDSSHQIDMFNAICFKAEDNIHTVKIECEIRFKHFEASIGANESRVQTNFTDKIEYFEKIDILKQFWGRNAFSCSNRELFIDRIQREFSIPDAEKVNLTDDVELIYSILEKTNSLPLFIDEKKEGIEKLIILPFKAYGTSVNKVTLKSSKELDKLKLLKDKISLGYWFHNVGDVKLKSINNHTIVNSEVNLKNEMTSPDFKIYFQVDKSVELKKNQVTLDSNTNKSLDAEIIQVYSQSEISYFKDWAELGIYNSTLLRLQNNTKVDSKIASGFETIESKLELEDIEAKHKKETNIFILGIFISALITMGLDATRLTSDDFLINFPKTPLFSEAFIWFLVCLGLVPKYLVLKNTYQIKSMYKKWIKGLSSLVFIWMVCCFFTQEGLLIEWKVEDRINLIIIELTHWVQFFPVFDIILTAYLFLSVTFYTYYHKHKRYMSNKFMNICKSIFGVQ